MLKTATKQSCQHCSHRTWQDVPTRGWCGMKKKFVKRKDAICDDFKSRRQQP